MLHPNNTTQKYLRCFF